MGYGVRLHVWGDRACFTRPEFKAERYSYDVITPSAARGILEALYWKPSIVWIIDRIHVLRPIRFQSMRRNEIGAKMSAALATQAMNAESADGLGLSIEKNRQQRATTLLVDVGYVIEAHFALTGRADDRATEAQHISMFNRRAGGGQCFHQPYLGTREFPANFDLVKREEETPKGLLSEDQRNLDLGWMLYDIEYPGAQARFFRARLEDGVLDVRRCLMDSVSS